jgi:methylglutaconyl-CoA hydratase
VNFKEAGPIALAQAKRAIRGGAHLPMDEAILFEIECYKKLVGSKDRVEGMKAFLEKRKPKYVGE